MNKQCLIVNFGSSSLKLKLVQLTDFTTLLEARAENLCSASASTITVKRNLDKTNIMGNFDYETALEKILEFISYDFIEFIGHRVVHGGTFFSEATVITNQVLYKIGTCCNLAPLHNPISLTGIKLCLKLFPKVPQVAVFDTTFHNTIPKANCQYPIPIRLFKAGVKKYGFHGISYSFLTRQLSNLYNKENINAILLQIGNGVSVCAIRKCESIYTSMQFSPLSGCIMGTRSGSIDPTIIQYLGQRFHYSVKEILHILNNESGLLALTGSNDMREILKSKDNEEAVDIFCTSIAQEMTNAIIALGEKPKQIVFSGGIGENSPEIRNKIIEKLSPFSLDICVNPIDNNLNSKKISSSESNIDILVLPTDEEKEIAIQASELLNK